MHQASEARSVVGGSSGGRRYRGLLLALCLLVFYVMLWRPARALFAEHVALPLLSAAGGGRYAMTHAADPLLVSALRTADGHRIVDYRAPVGIRFLAPVLLLLLLFPKRRYVLAYGGLHLVLGALMLAAYALGLTGVGAGFKAHGFVNTCLESAAGMAVAAWAVHYGWRKRRP